MNPRIQKITEDITKLRRRIEAAQTRIRELERQKIEIENTDIVALVRAIGIPPEELAAFAKRLQTQENPPPQQDITDTGEDKFED